MQISYDYYRVFYYAAKYKSFTAAANALLNNQPNITRAIKNLETALGCTLFIRSNRGAFLTPEGEKLYTHVSAAFEHIQAGEEELSLEKSLQRGIVSLGVTEIALNCLLLPILKEYRSLYPGVHIHITSHSTPQAITTLKNGLIDLAVITTPTVHSDSVSETAVKTIREVPVCSSAYASLLSGKIPLCEIINHPIISLGTNTKTYERYMDIFASYGHVFSPDIQVATTEQILPMVKADLGIGFVPEEMAERDPDIHVIDLTEEIPSRQICLVKRRGQSLSIASKELERLILSHRE